MRLEPRREAVRLPWKYPSHPSVLLQINVRPDLPIKWTSAKNQSQRRPVDIAEVSLTRGQVNAVRAAFKAGITPTRIARQFGISQSNVRNVLASDEPKR
jgi:predicted DNA binding protein